jgi:predicted MFS family arabinose efflux permease
VWILVAYGLLGLVASVVVVNMSPFLMSITKKEERSHAFSMQNAVTRLSGFAGNLLGGVLPGALAFLLGATLDEPAPFRYPLMIPPVLYFLGFLLLRRTQRTEAGDEDREEVVRRERVSEEGPSRIILMFSLVYLLWMAGSWSTRTFFNVYMDQGLGAATATIGLAMALGQLMAVPGSLLTPALVGRYGSFRTVIVALAALVGCQVGLAAFPRPLTAALAFVGTYVAFGAASPAFMVYCQEAVAPSWRPVMTGSTSMAWGLGAAGLIFGGGYIVAAVGYRVLFLTGAAMGLIGLLVFGAYFRTPRGEYARSTG